MYIYVSELYYTYITYTYMYGMQMNYKKIFISMQCIFIVF